ncbi:MAG: protein kinase, partial [Acidobacteria bacterium]|nr:protein kinase [Acidobacteriota bacterium]
MSEEEQIGKLLDGKYEVLQQLGTGGMGEIYLVRHLHLEQKRVVKILRRDLASDEAARRRFLREAQLATQIKHPNVAILYDFAQLPNDSFYMVSEFIDGMEIGQMLEKEGPLPLQQALLLGIQALRGLEA